ncbi:ligase-associated DNA damage response exonuclease [Geminicoccaceae bacterium 1502E]|nr:ligase-associated DNA damage response exonuclease [Geminicoccaceae bacterium 1502E]
MGTIKPADWLEPRPEGLFVKPGGFYVDPLRPVARAVVTHGHADHARPGHGEVIATPETLAIMRQRLGEGAGARQRPLPCGQEVELGEVRLRLVPAGHVLGSAQVVLEHGGCRVVCSGDYKRRPDPTCTPFEPVTCDLFITEATFALPVFRHPDPADEIARLLHSVELFPARCHVVGTYALGKAQRLIALLREAGWERPVFLHGALLPLCELYEAHGVALGDLRPATAGEKGKTRQDLTGEIVLAPPGAIADRWARRLPEPVVAMASGWMRVRQRAKQRGVELPLVISDHADWDELLSTIREVQAPEVWVTHGREEALVHAAAGMGVKARALALVGYEEEER